MNEQQKKNHRLSVVTLSVCLVAGTMLAGCRGVVLTNVVAGLREGATATATGIINAVFDQRFPAATTSGEENGNDLFVRM